MTEAVLDLWPQEHRRVLSGLIGRYEDPALPRPYAVFDADNTLWQHDLSKSVIALMEHENMVSPDSIDDSIKLLPFHPGETLNAHYNRLCVMDWRIGYQWLAQVFAGFTVGQLQELVKRVFTMSEPIPSNRWQADRLVDCGIPPVSIYPAQKQLIAALSQHGFDVWIISAAIDELVRAAAQHTGLAVAQERIIGVPMLLRDTETGIIASTRRDIECGRADFGAAYAKRILTHYPSSPGTWYTGKLAAILEYIDAVRRPALVAGDSENDHWMLFHADGVRLWIDRNEKHRNALQKGIGKRQQQAEAAGMASDADQHWLHVTPEALSGNST